MSPAAIIAIAVLVIIVLMAIVLVTAARRADVRGTGALSARPRRRDRDAEFARPVVVAQSGRAVERAVAARSTTLLPAAPSTPWSGPRPMKTRWVSAVGSSSTGPRCR